MHKFEKYLMEIHAKDYHGTDDDMPDDFERWLGELDTAEVMKYAEEILDKQDVMLNRLQKLAGEAILELEKIRGLLD